MIDLTKYQTYPHSFEIHPTDVFLIDIHPETVGNVVTSESLNPPIPVQNNYLYFEAKQANSTVSMMSNLETAPSLEYSTDGVTFQTWSATQTTMYEETAWVFNVITLGEVGDKVYFRGINEALGNINIGEYESNQQMSFFNLTGKLDAGGSITSLLDGTGRSTIIPDSGCPGLFGKMPTGEELEESNLVTANILSNITKVGKFGLYGLFLYNTQLESTDSFEKLVEIEEGGCFGMFMYNTSLEHAVDMPVLRTLSATQMPEFLGIRDMYAECIFNMSDDGETFNFEFPKEQIIAQFGEQTESLSELSDYEIADYLFGNTNGFVLHYRVNVYSDNSEYGTVSGSGRYLEGTQVTIEAIPNQGCRFVRWSDNNTDAVRTFTITENVYLTAYFEVISRFTVTLSSNNNEYGLVSGGGTYEQGTQVTIQATPAQDCQFVEWSDGNTDTVRTITVEENVYLTAYFEVIPSFTITLSSNNDEYGSVSGGGTYQQGTQITIQATSTQNCEFVQWSDGNTDATRTITVTENLSLVATFAVLNENYLNFTMPNGGDITLTKTGSPYEVQLEYSVDEKQTWQTWEEQSNVRSLTLPANSKIYLRSTNKSLVASLSKNDSSYYQFAFTDTVQAAGDITTLTTALVATSIGSDFCYHNLFKDCTSLLTPPELPATILTGGCYMEMFFGCTSLSAAPVLPATELKSICYDSMFYNCTSLTTAPELPATIIDRQCYLRMFYGCTSLTTVPETLPATSLDSNCYEEMFRGCSSLTTAPALPATILAPRCYYSMFSGCTSLTTVPEILPATSLEGNWSLSWSCYTRMFEGCTSLTTSPALPATTLSESCYEYMFLACTSLVNAPELPATSLTNNCYKAMFHGCTSLITAPDLPATTLVDSCYYNMFYDCTNLNHVKCSAIDISATNCTNEWLVDVSQTGTFEKPYEMNAWTRGGSGIPTGWNIEVDPLEEPFTIVNEEQGSNTITFKKNVNNATTANLSYSTDNGTTWTSFSSSIEGESWILQEGDAIAFKGDNNYGFSYNTTYNSFSSTGNYSVKGNIMSLLNSSNYKTMDSLVNRSYAFMNLFINSTKLINASKLQLPATTLAQYCYQSTFEGCTSLTQAPSLPATRVYHSSYRRMFMGCTSLTQAPALPAVYIESSCYEGMFQDCTSLTQAPELPATGLAYGCYSSMFSGCTSLTQAPELPATTLTRYNDNYYRCYMDMFRGCTSLTQAPNLPATTLSDGCYEGMFRDCTALTQVPELPATTLTPYCYDEMFRGCTSLTQAPDLPATTLAGQCYRFMFYGCTSLTQAPELPATTLISECYVRMFEGCTSLTEAPALPATTLASECYRYMFSGCTLLTQAPALPATNLVSKCYYEMFASCYFNMSNDGITFNFNCAANLPQTVDGTTYATSRELAVWMGNIRGFKTPYTLTLSSNNDSWGTVSGGGTYLDGDSVQIQATPAQDYRFVSWSDGNTNATRTITVTENISLTATFEENLNENYLNFTMPNGGDITLTKNGTLTNVVSLEYSIDNQQTWQTWEEVNNVRSLTLPVNGKVYIRSTRKTLPSLSLGSSKYYQFAFTDTVQAAGDVTTLATALVKDTASIYNYYELFKDCTTLTQAPELPATNLSGQCYYGMFEGCTSLTQAPELPATSLAITCYANMFKGCTSLTQAPELPATTLADDCYSWMFSNCTSLTSAPVLPATTLDEGCYSYMFYRSSVNYVKCLATDISATNCTKSWLSFTSQTGTFVKPYGMNDWPTDYSGIPSGWTVQDYIE